MIRARPTILGLKGAAFTGVLLAAWYASPYSNLFFLLLCTATGIVWVQGLGAFVDSRAGVRSVGRIPSFAAGDRPEVEAGIETGGRSLGRGVLEFVTTRRRRIRAVARNCDGHGRGSLVFAELARGVHPIVEVRWSSAWPFGLWSVSRPVACSVRELVVTPAPDSEETTAAAPPRVPNQRLSPGPDRAAPGLVRPFRTGDELRHVHWRATARRGEPVVVEWDECAEAGLEWTLDRRVDAEVLEQNLSRLATAVTHARQRGLSFRVRAQGFDSRFGPGERSFAELERFLATVQVVEAGNGEPNKPRIARRQPPVAIRGGGS